MSSLTAHTAPAKPATKFHGKAEQAVQAILDAFASGTLPKALAPIFIHRKDDTPCRKWSWNNQLLTALAGHSDARGFRQWQAVGRCVTKGQKSFQILSPMTGKREDKKTGETKSFVFGFRSTAVFGLSQTEGKELAEDVDAAKWLDALPLVEVAKSWGLSVESFNGQKNRALGWYRRGDSGKAIAVGVENLSTWSHEPLHAADDRLGALVERGQHWKSETVAELGGAILLEILGHETKSDRGGCFEYVKAYAKDAELEPIQACQKVLKRTCDAVALILDTAEQLAVATEGGAV
jgi:hypothetical protein